MSYSLALRTVGPVRQFFGTWGTAVADPRGTAVADPRHVSILGDIKVEIAGSFVVSSPLGTLVSKSSISSLSSHSWKTRFIPACSSILSKWTPSVVNLA